MADDLPPGFTLDAPATAGGELPAGFTLDKTAEETSKARIEAIKARMRAAEEGSPKPGYTALAGDAATMGLLRPLWGATTAAVGGLTGSDPGSTFGERYTAGVQREGERLDQAAQEKGWGGTAAKVAGSLVGGPRLTSPLPASVVPAGQLGGLLKPAVTGAAPATLGQLTRQGAVQGAVSGAAENADTTENATTGALKGAAIGGGTAFGLGALAKAAPAARRSATAEAQAAKGKSPEDLQGEAKVFFDEMDKGGIAYGQPQTDELKKGLDELVANNKYDPTAHPTLSGYFNKLDTLASQPQGAKLTELQNLRSAIAKQARGSDASTRGAAGDIVGEVDKLVHGTAPAVNPNNLDVTNLHKEASQKWRAAALADDIEWRSDKAARKVAVSPGTSLDAANRGAFKAIEDRVTKPGAYNPYSDDQKALLAKIVAGDRLQNAARWGSRTAESPVTRGVLAGAAGLADLHGGGGMFSSAGKGMAALQGSSGVAALLDRYAASRGQKNIDALLRDITIGPGSPAPRYGAATSRSDLAKILAAQAGARAAGKGLAE